jgi:hypothetical protein
VGGFWPRIYVVKKDHARDIYLLAADAQFLALQRPLFSLYVLLYLLASAFHRLYIGSSHAMARASRSGRRSADLRGLRCALV